MKTRILALVGLVLVLGLLSMVRAGPQVYHIEAYDVYIWPGTTANIFIYPREDMGVYLYNDTWGPVQAVYVNGVPVVLKQDATLWLKANGTTYNITVVVLGTGTYRGSAELIVAPLKPLAPDVWDMKYDHVIVKLTCKPFYSISVEKADYVDPLGVFVVLPPGAYNVESSWSHARVYPARAYTLVDINPNYLPAPQFTLTAIVPYTASLDISRLGWTVTWPDGSKEKAKTLTGDIVGGLPQRVPAGTAWTPNMTGVSVVSDENVDMTKALKPGFYKYKILGYTNTSIWVDLTIANIWATTNIPGVISTPASTSEMSTTAYSVNVALNLDPQGDFKPPFTASVEGAPKTFNMVVKLGHGVYKAWLLELFPDFSSYMVHYSEARVSTVFNDSAKTVLYNVTLPVYDKSKLNVKLDGRFTNVYSIHSGLSAGTITPLVLGVIDRDEPSFFVVESTREVYRVVTQQYVDRPFFTEGSGNKFYTLVDTQGYSGTLEVKLYGVLTVVNVYGNKTIPATVTIYDNKNTVISSKTGEKVVFKLEPFPEYTGPYRVVSNNGHEEVGATTMLPDDTTLTMTFSTEPALKIPTDVVMLAMLGGIIVILGAVVYLLFKIRKGGIEIEFG